MSAIPEAHIVDFLLVLPVLVISMVAHEYAHGYAALLQGDSTAQRAGRLTLNPIRHIDPFMSIMLPAVLWFGSGGSMLFGGAKPVPVDPRLYRQYRRGDIIVSLAGIATNLALVVVFCLLAAAIGMAGRGSTNSSLPALLQGIMFWGVWFNLLLANFNLIPIPPLDGSRVFYHLLPPEIGLKYRQLSRYGILILLALIYFFRQALYVILMPAIATLGMLLDLMSPILLIPFGVV